MKQRITFLYLLACSFSLYGTARETLPTIITTLVAKIPHREEFLKRGLALQLDSILGNGMPYGIQ